MNRRIEFTDGLLEPLPMPTDKHQNVLQFLFLAWFAFITPLGGKVHFAPLRVRIRPGKYREPDLLLVKSAQDPRRRNRFWTGADLALEVVPERDLIDKQHDYAEGKIAEYWIVSPFTETITVLRLENDAYVDHGIFKRGERAVSATLPGFSVAVDDVFNVDSPQDDEAEMF